MRSTEALQVLSAGDEETSRMLAAALGFANIEVIAGDSIAEAKRLAEIEDFQAHILGIRFPDGNGFELCRHLKRSYPYVPNIFLTGDVLAGDREIGLACGADAYLTKPYQGDICAFVLELISEGRQRRAAATRILPPHHRRSVRRGAGII